MDLTLYPYALDPISVYILHRLTLSRSTASTHSFAKWSLSCVRILDDSVVRAMFMI